MKDKCWDSQVPSTFSDADLVNSEVLLPLAASNDLCIQGGLDLVQAHGRDEGVLGQHSHKGQIVLFQLLAQLRL